MVSYALHHAFPHFCPIEETHQHRCEVGCFHILARINVTEQQEWLSVALFHLYIYIPIVEILAPKEFI